MMFAPLGLMVTIGSGSVLLPLQQVLWVASVSMRNLRPLTLRFHHTILKSECMLNFKHREGVITREFHPILEKSALFEGIHEENLSALLGCIGGWVIFVPSGQTVFREGDPATYVGMVLSGAVRMIREDYYGNRSIVAHIGPAELFGETYACAEIESLPVSIIAD